MVMRRKERYIYKKNLKRVRFKTLLNFSCPCRKFVTKALTAMRLKKMTSTNIKNKEHTKRRNTSLHITSFSLEL